MNEKPFDVRAFLATIKNKEVLHVPRNKVVYKAGTPAEMVYFLHSGRIKITAASKGGKSAVIGIISPGQFFSHATLTGHPLHISTAIAIVASGVVGIKGKVMAGLMVAHPDFGKAFMQDTLAHTAQLQADLVDRLFNDSEKRLARFLVQLAQYGNKQDPLPILGEISQDVIAAKIGVTRPYVTRFMNKFRRLGFISYDGHLQVHPALLTAVLHDGNGGGDVN